MAGTWTVAVMPATEALAGMDPAALVSDPAKMAEFQTKIADAMKAAGASEEIQAKLADLGKPAEGAPAEAALPVAAYLAGRCASRVTLLHIIEHDAPATVHGARHLRQ